MSNPYQPAPGFPPPAPPKKSGPPKWLWIVVAVAVLAVAGAISQGAGGNPSTSTAAAQSTTPSVALVPTIVPAAPVEPELVTIPEVKGRNGAIVQDDLRRLGLTKVRLASRDAAETVVVLPENWTAVSIEPGPGSRVATNQTVVVTLTKR